jgi:hypothetical protein
MSGTSNSDLGGDLNYNTESNQKRFNPIGAIGKKMKSFFGWFKKDKECPELAEEDIALKSDASNSSHKSADIDDPATTYHNQIM